MHSIQLPTYLRYPCAVVWGGGRKGCGGTIERASERRGGRGEPRLTNLARNAAVQSIDLGTIYILYCDHPSRLSKRPTTARRLRGRWYRHGSLPLARHRCDGPGALGCLLKSGAGSFVSAFFTSSFLFPAIAAKAVECHRHRRRAPGPGQGQLSTLGLAWGELRNGLPRYLPEPS